ncbi:MULTISPECIES: PAS domain-containing sensor histidine kinase [unclassified Flavobacterium]|uniref:PAS domain-containing sensor histidine kinase n=1 Tax=unclassified Flavobacterium TaxID=196869 RepID=UPI003F92279D
MIRGDQKITVAVCEAFNKFEKFFDATPDLLCVAGFDGYFKRINPAVSELLGYSNDELLSRPINDFVHDDDKKSTSNARNDLRSKIPLFNFENRYLTKNGAIVWLLWTSLPIEDDQHVYAIAKNITYKKELEEERNLNLAELTKINSDYKQLTYTSAHDLRSPVNNLLSVFELLDTSTIKDSETLEFIAILKSTSESLKQTLNEHVALLNKKNDDNAHLEDVSLNAVVNEVLLSINALVQNSQAQIRINFEALKIIRFNKSYLKSIFLNLITNAIKYSKSDVLPVISIYTEIKDGRKQLIVSDNGIGFDMEKVKDKIFGLHQKFHNHVDSNGIGLYLVYNHITSLGGHITVKSKVNQGAKFIITFKD